MFDKTKVPDFNPFRYKAGKTDFPISKGLYSHCDGETLWYKVEDKTELDLMKEKFAKGEHVVVAPDYYNNKWQLLLKPLWNAEGYKLIHKKHEKELLAYLADNSVDIEVKSNFYDKWELANSKFIENYIEDFEYRLKPKKKTISLAMFTCYIKKPNFNYWISPDIQSSLEEFTSKYSHDEGCFLNHHEIPNTRYEQEIDDEQI